MQSKTQTKPKSESNELDQLKAKLAELEKQLADQAELKSKAEQLDQLNQILATPEGRAEIGRQLGVVPEPTQVTEVNLDQLTDTEVQLYKMIQAQNNAFKKGLDDLQGLFTNFAKQTEYERVANTSVARVKAELGLDLSPEQIRKAIQDSGQTDPIKAIMVVMPDQVLTSLKQSPPTDKPNHVTSVQDVDIDKMSALERYQFLRQNPEYAQQLAANTPGSLAPMTIDTPTDQAE